MGERTRFCGSDKWSHGSREQARRVWTLILHSRTAVLLWRGHWYVEQVPRGPRAKLFQLNRWANSAISAGRCLCPLHPFRSLPWPSDSSATLLDCTAEGEPTVLKRLHCFYELALGDPSPFPLLRCVECLTKCFWKQIIRHCRLWLLKEDTQQGCRLQPWLCEMSRRVKILPTFQSAPGVISAGSLERGQTVFLERSWQRFTFKQSLRGNRWAVLRNSSCTPTLPREKKKKNHTSFMSKKSGCCFWNFNLLVLKMPVPTYAVCMCWYKA